MDRLPNANLDDEAVQNKLKQTECIICLEVLWKVKNEERLLDVKILSCSHIAKHYYHRICLHAWFKVKQVCPLCKGERILETHVP